MKITVLTDNHAGSYFLAEHGLSLLIEQEEKNILFDTGHSDIFLSNAKKLGINIQEKVNIVVLSHGHWDHGNGLRHLKDKPLISHPAIFMNRFRKTDNTPVGLDISKDFLDNNFQVTLTSKPLQLSKHIFYLGEIPRLNNFEAQITPFVDEFGNDDFVPDDSALAIIQDEKLIIISGCAHSGICNTCEYAKHVTGINTIKAVIGGFHLKFNNLQTQKTIQYFKEQNVDKLMPSHCTELPALLAFHSVFKINQVKTGQQFEI